MDFALSLIIGAASRFIPHPANVTPLGALIWVNSKKSLKQGISLALLVMIITDIFLSFSVSSIFVYIGFACYALFARIRNLNPIAGVLLGSVAFFIISNFGSWIGPWYEHTFTGLVRCYVNALPFFRNMLVGDLVFVTAIAIAQRLFSNFKLNLKEEATWLQKLNPAISRRKF